MAGNVGASIKELASSSGRSEPEFSIPAQLRQAFMEVPCKDRLVALAGVLRQVRVGGWRCNRSTQGVVGVLG